MDIQIGQKVKWKTGPGFGYPNGGEFTGTVRDALIRTAGGAPMVFVDTDEPVPCVLGRGSDMEWHTQTTGVWLHLNEHVKLVQP